ncbi:hypothetical protein M8J75_016130 [Diaphorina citri]|nr:hypothetical protein M8J75_016130 [Diaphorina citri]
MDERLLPEKTRHYSKNLIVPSQDKPCDKPHFKSYDDLINEALLESNIQHAKSKSENTLLAQYRHKRASRAEEELFDDNGSEERIPIDETELTHDLMDVEELNGDELNAVIERQIVETLLSPPIIVRAPSQSSSINTSFNYHHSINPPVYGTPRNAMTLSYAIQQSSMPNNNNNNPLAGA